MPLTLTITSARREVPDLQRTKVFETRGGTIGRTQGNDWVLPDPERFVSASHAKVQYREGVYYLGDTSTNGVFVNGSGQPVGTGNFVALRDGDRLLIGDYEIGVGIDGDSRSVTPPPGSGESDDLAGPGAKIALEAAPVCTPQAIPEDPIAFLEEAPLSSPAPWEARSDDRPQDAPASSVENPSFDQGTPLDDFFAPPSPGGGQIPEDWDMTGFSSTAPSADRSARVGVGPVGDIGGVKGRAPISEPLTERPPEAPQPVATPAGAAVDPIAPSPRAPARTAAPGGGNAVGELQWFLQGVGLPDVSIPPDNAPSLMTAIGGMFRELVQGVMEVLMARSTLKSEFRMTMTTVRPAENNPLKFSVDVGEALRALLTKQGPGYLTPAEAVHEGITDIKGHQVAMMAGMQAAFQELLRRFDPQVVERTAGKGGKLGAVIPAGRKAKCWDLYGQQYREIVREAEDHFQRLFGEEFARAYEEQIEQLRGGVRGKQP